MDVYMWLLFSLTAALCVCETHSTDFMLTVAHTNDIHAHFDQFTSRRTLCSVEDGREGKCYGGVARRAAAIQRLRNSASEPNLLLLDAGDQFQGTMWFHVYEGRAAAYFMNKLGYDAMALGNHEFDLQVSGLLPFLKNVTFPILSSNMDASQEPQMNGLFKKSTIVTVGREKIGIVGYTTKDTKLFSSPGNIIFNEEVEAVRSEVERLKSEGVNKIIALGHSGIRVDQQLATSVEGIDLVVGGHTNTFLYTGDAPSGEDPEGPYPLVVDQKGGGRCLVVQDYAFGKYLGHLQVTFNTNGEIISWQGNPILLNSSVPEDLEIVRELDEMREPLKEFTSRVIGRSHVFLDASRPSCRLKECNMGNMVAEAMVHQHLHHPDEAYWANVSIALLGGGSLRQSIAAGPITAGHVMEVLPFQNTIDIVELEGRHVLEMLEHSVWDFDPTIRAGKFLQMSGMRVLYDLTKPNGQRVVSVEVLCSECPIPEFESLDPDKDYKLLLNSFTARGGDGYSMVPKYRKRHHIFGDIDVDVVLQYITNMSPITTGLDGRIRFVDHSNDGKTPCTAQATSVHHAIWWTFLVAIFLCFHV